MPLNTNITITFIMYLLLGYIPIFLVYFSLLYSQNALTLPDVTIILNIS